MKLHDLIVLAGLLVSAKNFWQKVFVMSRARTKSFPPRLEFKPVHVPLMFFGV